MVKILNINLLPFLEYKATYKQENQQQQQS